jgi:hypothetical protein
VISGGIVIVLVLAGIYWHHCREDVVFFFTGAICGVIGEAIGVAAGVWTYQNPIVFGLPLWLIVIWGYAFLVFRRIRDLWFRLQHQQVHYDLRFHAQPGSILAHDLAVYGLLIAMVVGLSRWNGILTLLLTILLFVVLSYWHAKEDIYFVVAGGIIGPLMELIGTSVGAWHYSNPTWYIPVWLPLVYAVFAVVVRRTAVLVNGWIRERQQT